MKIIKLVFPALIFLLMATVAEAQQETAPSAVDAPQAIEAPAKKDKRANKGSKARKAQYEKMVTELNLSDAQQAKFKEVNKKYRQKMQDAKASSGDDWEAMKATMKNIRKEQNTEIKGILTAEQFTTYQKMQQEQRGKRQGRKGQFGPGGR